MKRILLLLILTVSASFLWGQSNELLDSFLSKEKADVATTMLLVAQSAGLLPHDASPQDGYSWAISEKFGKHVKKFKADEPVTLGLFYLALFKTWNVKGGLMYSMTGAPRYAAKEAGFLGYVEPSELYPNRTVPPYEVLTGISYVSADFAEGGNTDEK